MASVEAAVFSQFIAVLQPRLARAFVAAYGRERGEDALAEALAYAWAHFDELARREIDEVAPSHMISHHAIENVILPALRGGR